MKLEERDSFCQTLLNDRFQLRQTLEESRQQYAHSQVERNNLHAANVELRRHLEDHKQLINTMLEENRRLCLLMADLRFELRRADDVACGGSGAVVKLNHASDSSEVVERAADEQPGMVPYLHELGELSIIEDSEDSTEEVYHEAQDD